MTKIHTKVVYNMETGEVLEDISYEYEGMLVLCDGGGGTTTTTTTIPEKTATDLALDKLLFEYMQKSLSAQDQLFEYQKMMQEYQLKVLPQILATQEKLLPLQEAEAQFYLDYMPKQLEMAGLQLETAKKALAGEPLASEEQKKTLRTMADQYKENALAGLKDVGETLYEQAIQKGLARGIPYSDIARSFEGEVGKYIASETSSINREAERMYTQGLTTYPTAMAELAQKLSGNAMPTMPQISGIGQLSGTSTGGIGQLSSGSTGGMDTLNQLITKAEQERYGQATQTQNNPSGSSVMGTAATGLSMATSAAILYKALAGAAAQTAAAATGGAAAASAAAPTAAAATAPAAGGASAAATGGSLMGGLGVMGAALTAIMYGEPLLRNIMGGSKEKSRGESVTEQMIKDELAGINKTYAPAARIEDIDPLIFSNYAQGGGLAEYNRTMEWLRNTQASPYYGQKKEEILKEPKPWGISM